ncbi:MAG: hypothetical protein LBD24_05190 [Spirochaetaceae bacterium]|nr:hypothetical protein [Spirochaetaceae bacterium]
MAHKRPAGRGKAVVDRLQARGGKLREQPEAARRECVSPRRKCVSPRRKCVSACRGCVSACRGCVSPERGDVYLTLYEEKNYRRRLPRTTTHGSRSVEDGAKRSRAWAVQALLTDRVLHYFEATGGHV